MTALKEELKVIFMITATVLAVAMMLVLLAGCGSGAESTEVPKPKPTKQVIDNTQVELDPDRSGYPPILLWCEGDMLFAETRIERTAEVDRAGGGGSLVVIPDGCVSGRVPVSWGRS